ncbi:50S ribosomal protein L22 [Portibacter lacus]|uniref:Large ribosomal subunit protein uL22 n=2 Tax=Portibacter lacus TaxID=1099794 RepID=A0AA37SS81_9BACT|nr:50S ribosomal protein L22 [Portibacter lacus]
MIKSLNKDKMEAVAKLRNCPMSARKMRLVVDLIRGKSVDDALNILKYTKKEAAVWVEKLLLSAISNWENKNDMTYSADEYDLYVKTIFSDEGTMLKRFRPAPHGRAHRIRKRTNHVTLVVQNRIAIEALDAAEITQE